jgi:SPP1 gp7 family putative phage head morphogenesis protein
MPALQQQQLENQQMMNEQQTEQQMSELEQALLFGFSLLAMGLASQLVQMASMTPLQLWRLMIPSINAEYRELKQAVPTGLTEILRGLHASTLQMLQNQGINISDQLTSKDTDNIIQKRIANLTLLDRIERNRKRFIVQLRDVILQSRKKEESIDELSQRIRALVTSQASRMRLILRTEVHRIRNTIVYHLAQKASRIDSSIKKTWIAVMDNRTRQAHRELHGTTKPIEGLFDSTAGGQGPAPGLMDNPADNINCRCRLRLQL